MYMCIIPYGDTARTQYTYVCIYVIGWLYTLNSVFIPFKVETRLQVGKLNGVHALLKLLEPEGEVLSIAEPNTIVSTSEVFHLILHCAALPSSHLNVFLLRGGCHP